MVNEVSPKTGSALEASLDAALATALRAPAVPSDLRVRVLAAVAREGTVDRERGRAELARSYANSIAALNARYLRRCRDGVLVVGPIIAAFSMAVRPLAQWLTPASAGTAPIAAGLLALGLGIAFTAVVLQDLFGWRTR